MAGCFLEAMGRIRSLLLQMGRFIGQINRKAAAVLAPLMDASIIGIEVKSNQEADGQRNKALHVYGLLGVEGNEQVDFQPEPIIHYM